MDKPLPPNDQPAPASIPPHQDKPVVFAQTNFRNEFRSFGIKEDDRRRHMYMIGKTGMGKSTLLENMIIQDIREGRGLAVVDPHGDLVEKVVNFVPNNRINDVVYFNPADLDYPIAFNILESVSPEYKNLVSNGLVGVFKKIWADSWGPRLEYILINTILALLENPGSTLLGVTRMLVDTRYRKKILKKITDPVVRSFWVNEYNNYSEKFRNEAIAPIQNKVGQFLSSQLIRNIVGQTRSTIDMRELMDSGKILLMNLAKGRIGEENSALLGAMMITKMQLAAMSRVNIPEKERRDFYLYVDEFQNFATESFAGILSEARKYRLDLILAHQYIEQLNEVVAPAVFGNVGTLIAFRVGAADAEELEKEFQPTFMQEDLVTLPAHHIYLRLMIDGVSSSPFSASTLPPLTGETGNKEKVIQLSRERYAKNRAAVEENIMKWSDINVDIDEADTVDEPMTNTKTEDEKQQEKNEGAAETEQLNKKKGLAAPPPPPKAPKAATIARPQNDIDELRDREINFLSGFPSSSPAVVLAPTPSPQKSMPQKLDRKPQQSRQPQSQSPRPAQRQPQPVQHRAQVQPQPSPRPQPQAPRQVQIQPQPVRSASQSPQSATPSGNQPQRVVLPQMLPQQSAPQSPAKPTQVRPQAAHIPQGQDQPPLSRPPQRQPQPQTQRSGQSQSPASGQTSASAKRRRRRRKKSGGGGGGQQPAGAGGSSSSLQHSSQSTAAPLDL
ncbi:MAG: type IV secretion system DNA-binding domain-containing protein [Candidatus Kerfeldbacteria bacterium]|nr:type IV secretion system DNA-binding domain-containing protein [Candidatus Kerfeldbacteria bacterium]